MDAYLFLKAERERQRLSYAQVADYLGLTEDMVRRYDSGRSDISLRMATRYAECLGKKLGDVLPSAKVRASEAEPIMQRLQNFEPNEREEVTRHVLRTMAFIEEMMNHTRQAYAALLDAQMMAANANTVWRWVNDDPMSNSQTGRPNIKPLLRQFLFAAKAVFTITTLRAEEAAEVIRLIAEAVLASDSPQTNTKWRDAADEVSAFSQDSRVALREKGLAMWLAWALTAWSHSLFDSRRDTPADPSSDSPGYKNESVLHSIAASIVDVGAIMLKNSDKIEADVIAALEQADLEREAFVDELIAAEKITVDVPGESEGDKMRRLTRELKDASAARRTRKAPN